MEEVKMYAVESTNLNEIGYDEDNCTLYIRFQDGGLYQYEEFPPDQWEAFRAAGSPGSFFHRSIKGRYNFVKMEE